MAKPSAAEQATPVAEFVRRYRRDVAQIAARTLEVTGERPAAELVAMLHDSAPALAVAGTPDHLVLHAAAWSDHGGRLGCDPGRGDRRALRRPVALGPVRVACPAATRGAGHGGQDAGRDPRRPGARPFGRGPRAAVHRGPGGRRSAAHQRDTAERRRDRRADLGPAGHRPAHLAAGAGGSAPSPPAGSGPTSATSFPSCRNEGRVTRHSAGRTTLGPRTLRVWHGATAS